MEFSNFLAPLYIFHQTPNMMMHYLDGSVFVKNLLQVGSMDILISNEDVCLTSGYSNHPYDVGVRQTPEERIETKTIFMQ